MHRIHKKRPPIDIDWWPPFEGLSLLPGRSGALPSPSLVVFYTLVRPVPLR